MDLVGLPPPVVRADAAREVVVVVSRSRDPEREIVVDRCREDRVPVVVRPSGGGAVVLAPGVVAASALLEVPEAERFPDPHFRRLCGAVADALSACGAPGLAMRGISDLALGDRKVAGSSLRIWRARLLFQVSVLVDADVDLLERYLRLPSRAPDYRRGRTHRAFVTTLREAGFTVTVPAVVAALAERLRAAAVSR